MLLRTATLALMIQAATGASLSPRGVVGSLRMRGGATDEETAAAAEEAAKLAALEKRALTREEITAKLNGVPTFCIQNAEGGIVGMRGKDGKEAVCWFTDPAEARAILRLTKEANPTLEGLHLGCHGLGAAFTVCKGWGADDEQAAQATGSEPFGGEFRLQGPMQLIKELGPKLSEQLAEQGVDASAWTLPIFICAEMQSAQILPVFLSPADLEATWLRAGGSKDNVPERVTVMDIRTLIQQMQTDTNPWQILQFVGSQAGVELAEEIQSERRADRDASMDGGLGGGLDGGLEETEDDSLEGIEF